MDLDTVVIAGEPPWLPSPAAHDLDVWEKYDFPNCGTFRVGAALVMFSVVATSGPRSVWAYVSVPVADEDDVTYAWFDSEAEVDAFIAGRFAGREGLAAMAEDFKVRTCARLMMAGEGDPLDLAGTDVFRDLMRLP